MKPNQFEVKMNPFTDKMWLVHQRYGKPATLLKDIETEVFQCLAAELHFRGLQDTTRTFRFDDGGEMEIIARYTTYPGGLPVENGQVNATEN